ncbi:helix-turn-helix domain-containing protein, partial [Streptomyces lavendulocolor]|uniref:helix-turn-helix domain-containing protein n=1 Tax=Streptomyces lavendulocolor TaxID=67316 RepID=UPI0033FC4720
MSTPAAASDGPGPSGPGPSDASSPSLPDVAPQLRALRRRRGLTLEAAAQRAGLSPAHLSRLETGRRQPSLPMLLGLARVYGTTVSELLGEVPAERDPVVRGGRAEPAEADGWVYHQAGGPGRAIPGRTAPPRAGNGRAVAHPHPGR